MSWWPVLIVFFLTSCGLSVNSAKILGIFPFFSKSHYALGNALLKELALRGHDVTMIAVNQEKDLPSNVTYRQIKLNFETTIKAKKRDMFGSEMTDPYVALWTMHDNGIKLTKAVFDSPGIRKLLESGEKFDAVIMDHFVDDSIAYFAHHFNAVHILMSSMCANSWINPLVANPSPLSVNPEMLLEYRPSMTFFERLRNAYFYFNRILHREFYFFRKQNDILKEHFPDARPLHDYIYNVSLLLMNSHESFCDPVPFVPVIKNVGGLHVSPSGKLPNDLQKFMDDAKDGVVYFSMGSNLKSKDMPVKMKDSILRVFNKLKVKVLWKWEDETLPNQPSNVKLNTWFPQQEILAHPNLKAFITHGGLLSTLEAVYHGVPLLTIPVYGDQKINAVCSQNKGYAINVPFAEFEEARFESALNELLENPKYKRNAAERSRLFHDRPMKPLDEAVFWVEYVIRHGGAEHLRVAALKLTWYQYLLLDVLVFVSAVVAAIFYILKFIFKNLCLRKNKKLINMEGRTEDKMKLN